MDDTVEQRARRGQQRRRRRTRRGFRGGRGRRRPLPRINVTKPLTIPFLRKVFSPAAEQAIDAAARVAVEIERVRSEIFNAVPGGIIAECKRVAAERQEAVIAAGRAHQARKPQSSALATAQLGATKIRWRTIYFTFLNRLVESYDVSNDKLRAQIGDVLFAELEKRGYGYGGQSILHRYEKMDSTVRAATELILRHFRRRIVAMQGDPSTFAVRTLYVPFAANTVLAQRRTNARGAYVTLSPRAVQVVYLPPRARVKDYVYKDERIEDRESESFELRGGATNADKPTELAFDAIAKGIVGRVVDQCPAEWVETSIFMTPSQRDELVDALHGVDLSRVAAIDPGVGLLTLARPTATTHVNVRTNRTPFVVRSRRHAARTPAQRQAHKRVFQPAKLRAEVARALAAAAGDDGTIDVVLCGDGFGNKPTTNAKKVGGFAHPRAFLAALPPHVVGRFCTEVFTTRIGCRAAVCVLLKRVATLIAKGRKMPVGRILARATDPPPQGPPNADTMRASIANTLVTTLDNGAPVVVDANYDDVDPRVRDWSALRGRVVESHVLDVLRQWRGVDGRSLDVAPGQFMYNAEHGVCGTADAIVCERDAFDRLGSPTVVEVKSTMREITWSLLLSWFVQVQTYMLLHNIDNAYLIVKPFSPSSPYVKSKFRLWRIGRLDDFGAIVARTDDAVTPRERAASALRYLAANFASRVVPALLEIDVNPDAALLLPVARALVSPLALDTRQLRADIGATLKASFKTPLVFDDISGPLLSFVYCKRGVLWDPNAKRFVGRDASAARSIAYQAHAIANDTRMIELAVHFGGRRVVVGYLVPAPLAAAAKAYQYNMERFVLYRDLVAKRRIVYILKALCDGQPNRLDKVAAFDWRVEAQIVGTEQIATSTPADAHQIAVDHEARRQAVAAARKATQAASRRRKQANATSQSLTALVVASTASTKRKRAAAAPKRRSDRAASASASAAIARTTEVDGEPKRRRAATGAPPSTRKRKAAAHATDDDDDDDDAAAAAITRRATLRRLSARDRKRKATSRTTELDDDDDNDDDDDEDYQ